MDYTCGKHLEEVRPVKVFLVSLILLVLVATLFFMVSSQNTIAPIVYLTQPMSDKSYPPDFNFEVMDVNTGDIIFKSKTEIADCPYSISPDGHWLIYRTSIGQTNLDYKLLNLVTSEEFLLDFVENQFSNFYWFSDSSGFLLSAPSEIQRNEYSIYQYDVNSETLNTVTTVLWPLVVYPAADSFVYVNNNYRQRLLTIYQLDGQSMTFEYTNKYFGIVAFSSDGRYLSYITYQESYRDGKLYILDTIGGDTVQLTDAQIYTLGTWYPLGNAFLFVDTNRRLSSYNVETNERSSINSSSIYDEHVKYIWSPDGQYLSLEQTLTDLSYFSIFDYENQQFVGGESSHPDYWGTAMLRWISPTEFAHIDTDIGLSVVEGEEKSDVFLYNIETQTSINLTNTPDIIEFKSCFWG
jgi:hypothetical protein